LPCITALRAAGFLDIASTGLALAAVSPSAPSAQTANPKTRLVMVQNSQATGR